MDISEDKADAFSGGLMSVEDIDANDFDNPQLVSEYVNDIYDYMRSLEVSFIFIERERECVKEIIPEDTTEAFSYLFI